MEASSQLHTPADLSLWKELPVPVRMNRMNTYNEIRMLWRVDPLPGKDGETSNETTAHARQQPERQWADRSAITW